MADEVDQYELPTLYGGMCNCEATCIYSEKGPWTEIENRINYKDPKPEFSDEEDDMNEGFNFKIKAGIGGIGGMGGVK